MEGVCILNEIYACSEHTILGVVGAEVTILGPGVSGRSGRGHTILGLGVDFSGGHDGETLESIDNRRQRRAGGGFDGNGDGALLVGNNGTVDGTTREVFRCEGIWVPSLAVDIDVELAHGVASENA